MLAIAAAQVPAPPALSACAVRYSAVNVEAIPNPRSGLEQLYPAGTREYLGRPMTFYVMSSARRTTLSLDGDAQFRCTSAGLEVLYHQGSQRVVYPRGSAIIRETALRQYFVKPGEPLPADLRAGLRAGTIPLNKTL